MLGRTLVTVKRGWPGSVSVQYCANKRACRSVPPPAEKPTSTRMVLPEKYFCASKSAARAAPAAASPTSAPHSMEIRARPFHITHSPAGSLAFVLVASLESLDRHGLCGETARMVHGAAPLEIGVDDRVIGIAYHAERIFAALDLLDVLEHGPTQQHDAAVGRAEELLGAVGNGALSLPHDHVLRQRPAMPWAPLESCLGMVRIGRMLEGRDMLDLGLAAIFSAVLVA